MPISIPTTADILKEIGSDGVIVGSWPEKQDSAKDLDVVVRDRGHEDRNPVFERLRVKWPAFVSSSTAGHLWVDATPISVELFEGKATAVPSDDPEKRPGVLSYTQAVRRSSSIDAYGVKMRAVRRRK